MGTAIVVTAAGSCVAAGVATAVPPQKAPQPAPAAVVEVPEAGAPVPVSGSEISFQATHAVTQRAASQRAAEGIASLPVPAQYRPANLALAKQFDLALQGALASPGGCLQVVVDPRSRSGNLFNYGFFPVEGRFCS
nr:hypothetical protein [Gordonia soli]